MISEEYVCSKNNYWGQMQNFIVSQQRELIYGTTVLKKWKHVQHSVSLNKSLKITYWTDIEWTNKEVDWNWFGTVCLFELCCFCLLLLFPCKLSLFSCVVLNVFFALIWSIKYKKGGKTRKVLYFILCPFRMLKGYYLCCLLKVCCYFCFLLCFVLLPIYFILLF